jgi:hypothetical protein
MSAVAPTLPVMLRIGDETFAELLALEDAEELCRRLLATPGGWGRSTHHQEAVELLVSVSETSELPPVFVALMVCTCQRWDRVTARLIAAVEQSGLLDNADLDELAESLLSHEHLIAYPLAWVSPEWLEIELDDDNGHTHTVSEDTLAHHRPVSSRRCAAGQPAACSALTRPGSRSCSTTRSCSSRVTATRSSTACSTPHACSTSHSSERWSPGA